MRISSTHTGRILVRLTPDEVRAVPGPWKIWVDQGQKHLYIETATFGSGSAGSDPHPKSNETQVQFQDPAIALLLGVFEPITVMANILPPDRGTVAAFKVNIAEIGRLKADLPEPLKRNRSRVETVNVVNQAPAPRLADARLGDLVEELNRRRDADGSNLVYSIDADGYLEVIVSYGRRKG